ncbi:MAG: DMT family transporter [Rhodobacteraceae bacterium]|nr:DMT family transporter [Paracoccaceae bacterium]
MNLRAILMGLAFALMWSSAFTSARIIVAAAPPLTALAVRFALSGVIGVTIAALLGQSARLSRRQWGAVILFGICQNALYLGLNFIAMQTIEASLAAIIASSMPLLVALAGWLIFRETVRPLGLLGLFAGMAGVAIIMGARLSGGADAVAIMLCGIGALALAFATLAVRGVGGSGNLLMVVGLQMLVGTIALLPFALALETPTVAWSWQLIAAFTYTVLVPGLLATWVWFKLVGQIGAVKAATFHFLNPFLGVTVAAILLGETLGWYDALGVVVITLGILAVQMSKQSPRGRESA